MFFCAAYFCGIRHMHKLTGESRYDRFDRNATARNVVETIIAAAPVLIWAAKSLV